MSYLHDRLIEQYLKHYNRVNITADPHKIKPCSLKEKELMYGPLIETLSPGSRVLDLGCGTGFLLYYLSRHPKIIPVGVDSSETQVEAARKYLPGVEIYYEEGLAFLRKHPNTFSGIFCIDVLEHILNEDICLEWIEAARDALVPGGFFYCRVPNAANLTGNYSRYMDLTHRRVFSRPSVLQFLDIGGFKNIRVIPIQFVHITGKLRLTVEYLLHKIIFLICGHGLEYIFTSNVCAVGFKDI